MPTNYQKFIPLVILVLLAAGAFLFWQNRESEPQEIPHPDLARPVEVSADLTDDQKSQAASEIAKLAADLKNDLENSQKWLALAAWRFFIGDFDGAEEIWLYQVEANPKELTAYLALGEFYHLTLRDYQKSETYLRKAVGLEPGSLQAYLDLYELYRYSYQSKAHLAPEILKEGLENNPGNLGLLFSLAQYYEGSGKIQEARDYYLKAREAATLLGDQRTVERLDEILTDLAVQPPSGG